MTEEIHNQTTLPRSLYEGLEIPFTEEELRQPEQETESYTTAEVLAYLERCSHA